jgi:DinB superfamily
MEMSRIDILLSPRSRTKSCLRGLTRIPPRTATPWDDADTGMSDLLPEPWLRGVIPGVDPVTGHLLRTSLHIREDIERALQPLTITQLWAMPDEMTPAGFHAKHLAGSTERLCAYLEGHELTAEQLAAIAGERAGSEPPGELIARVDTAFDRYDRIISELRPGEFGDIREIGRKRLQTTAIGLAIHIAEHGQRHVGQAISAARLARATVL